MNTPKPADRLRVHLDETQEKLGLALYLIEHKPDLASALRSRDVVFHLKEATDHLLEAQAALLP